MKWKYTEFGEWHKWFAWHPVWINGQGIWLEWVERREDWLGDDVPEYEYRSPAVAPSTDS